MVRSPLIALGLAIGVVLTDGRSAAQQPGRTREIGVKSTASMPRPARAPLRQDGTGEEYEFGHYHALLIGVQRYEGHEADLRTAHEDVQELGRVLQQDYQFEVPRILLDEQASRSGILAALDELSAELDEDDSLLIFFAGHGTKAWTGAEYEEGFWVPYLAPGAEHRWWNWLSAQTLNRATARIRARHVLLISDSCYSGALTRDVRAQQVATPDFIRIQHERSSNHILTSGADEPVADDGRDGHSIFAYHLLDALTNNIDRCLPAATLADHLVRAVMQDDDYHRGRRSQQPLFARHPIDPRNDGQLIFVRAREVDGDGVAMTGEPGAPPGYRFPNFIEVEEAEPGSYRYWSIEGGTRVEMVLVLGGTWSRGAQTVAVEPFLIDLDEVTNERFDRFIDATGFAVGYRPVREALRRPRVPATGMNHVEARAFAAWAGNKRLPTADEWEAAAGFDPTRQRVTRYPWGDDAAGAELPELRLPAPVGSYPADRSHFGVQGMGGSVRELCELGTAPRRDAVRGLVRGGTQVRRGARGLDYAVVGNSMEVAATAKHEEGLVGFRSVKSLIPPYRRH